VAHNHKISRIGMRIGSNIKSRRIEMADPALEKLGDRFRSNRIRWIGAALGVIAAFSDAMLLSGIGLHLQSGGHDVTLVVAAWFGMSFAFLGYMLGKSIQDNAREKAASELIRAQMKALEESRAQLVQSEKLAALGQLAAAIAHEVRNPLAVIRSAAQSFGEGLTDGDPAMRASSFITDEIDRLSNLVNSLLTFARPVQVTREPVAIGELLDRATLLASDEIVARKIVLRREVPASLPLANADRNLIAQVVAGLLNNAAQAVPAGGEILLQAKADASRVEIAVADSGPGIAPENRSRVFEPFFTTRARGVGLGLAIARQVVEAHGGKIELSESPIGGARFCVSIPISHAVGAAA